MDQIPAAMDRHLDVIRAHTNGGVLLAASNLTGRYWLGSLWFYGNPDLAPDVEKCTAGVLLESGVNDAIWVDDDRVLVGLDSGGVEMWRLVDDLHTFEYIHCMTEHDDLVSCVSLAAGGKHRAASSSYDCCIKIWDLENCISTHTYRAHCDLVTNVVFHPSEPHTLISTSQDGSMLIWDTRKPKPAKKLDKSPITSCITAVSWKPGCTSTIAVGDEEGNVVMKDVRNDSSVPSCSQPHNRTVHRLRFCPSRTSVVVSVSDDCRVVVSDFKDGNIRQFYKSADHTDFVRDVAWVAEDHLYSCSWDSRVRSHHVDYSAKTGCTYSSSVEVNMLKSPNTGLVNAHNQDIICAKLNNACVVNPFPEGSIEMSE